MATPKGVSLSKCSVKDCQSSAAGTIDRRPACFKHLHGSSSSKSVVVVTRRIPAQVEEMRSLLLQAGKRVLKSIQEAKAKQKPPRKRRRISDSSLSPAILSMSNALLVHANDRIPEMEIVSKAQEVMDACAGDVDVIKRIKFAFRSNSRLVGEYLDNVLTPAELVHLDDDALASEESKKAKREVVKLVSEKKRWNSNALAHMSYSDNRKCLRCSKVGDVTFLDLKSTRSSHKAETWGSTSASDTTAFQYECQSCGFGWKEQQ